MVAGHRFPDAERSFLKSASHEICVKQRASQGPNEGIGRPLRTDVPTLGPPSFWEAPEAPSPWVRHRFSAIGSDGLQVGSDGNVKWLKGKQWVCERVTLLWYLGGHVLILQYSSVKWQPSPQCHQR